MTRFAVKRLTPATLFMLMLIGVGGLVLAYAGKKLLATAEVVEGPAVELLPVAVADLPVGTVITEAHIGQARILRDRIAPETARSERVILGRVVKNPLKRAEPINMVDLYPPGEGPPLDIAPGMRAVTIDMGDAATVTGLKTGQYVDVHFTPSSISDPVKGPFTMTLFKGVKVLALGAAANSRSAGGVTLELSPEQANIMILAKDKGALQLTYTPEGKGSGGVELEDADRATLAEILGLSKPQEEKPPFVTEIYSGSGRRTQLFQNGQRTDYYGVERYDYNRITPAVNGFGSSTGWNGDSFGGSGDDSGSVGGLNGTRTTQPAGNAGGDNGGNPAGGQNIGTPNGSFAAFGRSGTGEGL